MSVPTPPIDVAGGPAAATARFGPGVDVEDGLVDLLRGTCTEVVVDDAALAEAGRDWWPLAMRWAVDGQVPVRAAVIARPSSSGEVAGVLALCNEAGVPVTASAGRSGVCGSAVPVHGGVVLDVTAMAGITAVDDASLTVTALPGTFGDDFERDLRTGHGLTVGHWPQSMALSTVGGWVACRGAGQYSTRYGKIEDIVSGLEVVLADGRVVRTGGVGPRAAVGPDLTQIFVGSEGTLGVITSVTMRAHPVPEGEARSAWGFGSFAAGLDVCRRILRRGATPAVLRLYDEAESRRSFDAETNVLIVLDEADPALTAAVAGVVDDECRRAGGDRLDDGLVERWLEHRNDVSGLEKAIRRDFVVDTIEVAGPWAALPALYEDARAAALAVPGTLVCTAHQSHAYTDGACLYFTFAGARPRDGAAAEGWDADRYYRSVWDAVSTATMDAGCALSHHHGVGINRGRFVATALGTGFDVLAALESTLDPRGILNPGKLGLPSPFGPAPWPPPEEPAT